MAVLQDAKQCRLKVFSPGEAGCVWQVAALYSEHYTSSLIVNMCLLARVCTSYTNTLTEYALLPRIHSSIATYKTFCLFHDNTVVISISGVEERKLEGMRLERRLNGHFIVQQYLISCSWCKWLLRVMHCKLLLSSTTACSHRKTLVIRRERK